MGKVKYLHIVWKLARQNNPLTQTIVDTETSRLERTPREDVVGHAKVIFALSMSGNFGYVTRKFRKLCGQRRLRVNFARLRSRYDPVLADVSECSGTAGGAVNISRREQGQRNESQM